MNKPTQLTMIELAGWGGGPGMIYGITLVGPMTVTYHEDGAVVIHTEGDVAGPEWALRHLNAHSSTPPHSKDDLKAATNGHVYGGETADEMNRENREHRAAFKTRLHTIVEKPDSSKRYGILPEGRVVLTHVSRIRMAG